MPDAIRLIPQFLHFVAPGLPGHPSRANTCCLPLLTEENEGHGFRNEENQFEFYGKMASFLQQHLSPQ